MTHEHGSEYQVRIVHEDEAEELSGWLNCQKLMPKREREQTIAEPDAPDAPALMPDPEQLITTETTLPVAMKIEWVAHTVATLSSI